VALIDPVLAQHAPVPTSEAERLVFAQLFETLVTVDCRGQVRPGLAREWSKSPDAREWRFTLRPNARFSDGSHLSAEDVRRSWEEIRLLQNRTDGPARVVPWAWVRPESVRTLGEDVLHVSLTEPQGDDPTVFAHPALAVVKGRSSRGWPLGSGAYLLSMARRQEISCLPNPFCPGDRRGHVPLVFRSRPGTDARDLLAEKPDALLARDRSVLEYAGLLPDYSRSLPGGRCTYYLVSSSIPFPASQQDPDYAHELTLLRRELARDVEGDEPGFPPADARPVETIWSSAPATLYSPAPLSRDPLGRPRLVYPEDDDDARRIAERVVARVSVSRSGSASPQSGEGATLLESSGLPGPAASGTPTWWFDLDLDRGEAWGYIVPARSNDPRAERDTRKIFSSLAWFEDPSPREGVEPEDPDQQPRYVIAAAVPLVSTYSRLILRDGVMEVLRDGLGTFRFFRTGRGEASDLP
jgi:hypothetical protein